MARNLHGPAAVGAGGSGLGGGASDGWTSSCCARPSSSPSAAWMPRLHVSPVRAPLLALPPLVMLLFYLRGLYRTRLRALVLDGIVPVLSGVSVAAMARGDARDVPQRAGAEPDRLAARLAVRADRRRARARGPVVRPALGARAPPRGQAGADHGRRRGRRAGGAAPGVPSRVRARPDRLPRRGSALGGRGRRARRARAGHDRGPRRDRSSARASGT